MSDGQAGRQSADLAWCHEAVQGVSRTFALTIASLDDPMADEICVGYLLCRVADTIEDAGHVPATERRDLLRTYSRALDPDDRTTVQAFRSTVEPWAPTEPDADWEVVLAAPRVVRTFQGLAIESRTAIRPAVRELTDGMATFVDRYAETGGLRLRTFAELEEYCWYVAGTIGSFVTELLADDIDHAQRATFREQATDFARLLQLVNVAKDVTTDYREEDNVYLPAELLAEWDVEPADIDAPDPGSAFAPVIERVVERADGYLDGAQAWLETMPETRGNTLAAWAIPFLLAVGTIRELETRPEDVFDERGVKVSRAEVEALRTRFAEGDPQIDDLRRQMRRVPLTET